MWYDKFKLLVLSWGILMSGDVGKKTGYLSRWNIGVNIYVLKGTMMYTIGKMKLEIDPRFKT